MMQRLKDEYAASSRNEAAQERARHESLDSTTLERVR
jgi:hypothetical protein